MTIQRVIDRLTKIMAHFRNASSGNVALTFAIVLVPVMGSVGAAVDYSQSSSIKAAMQSAADVAALGTVKLAPKLTPEQIQSTALGLFNASFKWSSITPAVTATYDPGSSAVTVSATASYKPKLVNVIGISQIGMAATSKATIAAKSWQICVMVTEEVDNHTLKVEGGSKIEFENCMVQVNTANWDAVEARDTSYIHSKNGENCFVGDIHYGDVQPPKNPTCTFFEDPFSGLKTSAVTCDYTKMQVSNAGVTLQPGTYCGGLIINASTTMAPGLYIINGGSFKVTGSSTNITANNVTIVLAGVTDNVSIETSGTITMSPMTTGQFAGFLIYNDDPEPTNPKKKKKGGSSKISKATLNATGVWYMPGQKLEIVNGATMNIKPGSIIADYILPDGGSTLNLTGTLNSSLAVLNSLKKGGAESGSPRLIN